MPMRRCRSLTAAARAAASTRSQEAQGTLSHIPGMGLLRRARDKDEEDHDGEDDSGE